MQQRYKNIISRVSKELNLPNELVEKTYSNYWKFIKDSIEQLPLKDNLTQEEFGKLRTSINIPSLGKLNCTYERYLGIKARFKIITQIRNNKV